MDRIDRKILEYLQADGQMSNQDLANQIALSPSSCSRRVKHLEETGVIKEYVALLNPEKIGLQLTILVLVELSTHDPKKMSHFEKTMGLLPEVLQCYLITGQSADYMLKVTATDLNHFQSFLLRKLTCIDGVTNVHSSFVLSRVVDQTALPLDHLK